MPIKPCRQEASRAFRDGGFPSSHVVAKRCWHKSLCGLGMYVEQNKWANSEPLCIGYGRRGPRRSAQSLNRPNHNLIIREQELVADSNLKPHSLAYEVVLPVVGPQVSRRA